MDEIALPKQADHLLSPSDSGQSGSSTARLPQLKCRQSQLASWKVRKEPNDESLQSFTCQTSTVKKSAATINIPVLCQNSFESSCDCAPAPVRSHVFCTMLAVMLRATLCPRFEMQPEPGVIPNPGSRYLFERLMLGL